MEESPDSVMDAGSAMFQAVSEMGLEGYMRATDLGFSEEILLAESVAGMPDECIEQLKEKVFHPVSTCSTSRRSRRRPKRRRTGGRR